MPKKIDALDSREDIEQDLAERAQDPDFRERLLADPVSVLSETYGMSIPADIKVTVHEENANNIHFVLPMPENSELSDDELDAVAGGRVWIGCQLNVEPCLVDDADQCGTDSGSGKTSGGTKSS